MKWIKEIKAVGIRDWIWFVLYLRRNEFSHKLDMMNPKYRGRIWGPDDLMADRQRAHKIDMKLEAA